ncbi:MAG: TerC family protein [Bacteroidota bacterium]
MEQMTLMWVLFNGFVLAMLALDLGIFHKTAHEVKMKEALTWSAVWIACALMFNALIYFYWDWMAPGSSYANSDAALAFLTGYLIEKSLSVDNVFVFLMIFTYFQVPSLYQHKVLFWGILGALIMRAMFIFAGVSLITTFHWMIYIFGALLLFTGVNMAIQKDKKLEPDKNPVIRLFKRWFPVTDVYHGDHFFARVNNRNAATPMFIVLLVIETTDVIFAVDSIPAILAITSDPFIVYTSNVFAILGLRALYFALAGIMGLFHYLNYGLAVILVFVGLKMMLVDLFKIPVEISLIVVMVILLISVILSKMFPPAVKTA